LTSSNSRQYHQPGQQRPIGSAHAYHDPSVTSPISITTDSLPNTASSTSCFPSTSSTASSSNYFLDQWSNHSSATDLLTKSKTVNDLDLLADDFFNSTMLKAKSGWSSVIDHNDMGKDSHHFSPYFDASQEINQSPNLTAYSVLAILIKLIAYRLAPISQLLLIILATSRSLLKIIINLFQVDFFREFYQNSIFFKIDFLLYINKKNILIN